jgi:hypothetical protein
MQSHSLYILDAAGCPVPCQCVTDWRAWFDAADRTVALDTLPSGTSVHTVFLSLNHAFRPGPPVLWETVVEGGPCEQVVRYTSGDDAIDGHESIVNAVMAAEAALAERARTSEYRRLCPDRSGLAAQGE